MGPMGGSLGEIKPRVETVENAAKMLPFVAVSLLPPGLAFLFAGVSFHAP